MVGLLQAESHQFQSQGRANSYGKRSQVKWLLLPLLRRKRGKVQKNKPVLISNEKLQVENEGKPTSL